MTKEQDFSYIDGSREVVFDDKLLECLKKTKAIAIDLDGTLTNSIGNILKCTHYTLGELGYPQPSDKAIMSTIGKELSEALTSLLPEDKKSEGQYVTKRYREFFMANADFQIDHLFKGILPLMQKLREKGIKIGYASGRAHAGIMRTLNGTFLGEYCDGIAAGNECPSKPDPTMMNLLAQRLDVKCEEILGIGDSGLDILLGQNAHTMTLGVQTGVWSGDALLKLKPDAILKEVGDLTSYLDKL